MPTPYRLLISCSSRHRALHNKVSQGLLLPSTVHTANNPLLHPQNLASIWVSEYLFYIEFWNNRTEPMEYIQSLSLVLIAGTSPQKSISARREQVPFSKASWQGGVLTSYLAHSINQNSYPEWPHRQCVGLSFEVAGSRLTQCSKSCDLHPALQCAIRGAQGVLPCVGWGVRPVNWIYRLWCHCP